MRLGISGHQDSGSLLGNFGHQNSENLLPSRNTNWEKNDPCVGLSPREMVTTEKATGRRCVKAWVTREERLGEAELGNPRGRKEGTVFRGGHESAALGRARLLTEDFRNAF